MNEPQNRHSDSAADSANKVVLDLVVFNANKHADFGEFMLNVVGLLRMNAANNGNNQFFNPTSCFFFINLCNFYKKRNRFSVYLDLLFYRGKPNSHQC